MDVPDLMDLPPVPSCRVDGCERPRVLGAMVCAAHGGSAPQVVEGGRRRLLDAARPELRERLERMFATGDPMVLFDRSRTERDGA